MHLPALLTRTRTRTRTSLPRAILSASGIRNTYLLLVAALVITLSFPDGTISNVGPIHLLPELRVIVVVPLLLATACGLRVMSLADQLAEASVLASSLRNFLWLSGVATTTGAVFGLAYAWLPVMLAFTLTMLSPAGESDWSPYGFLFRDTASDAQLFAAAVVAASGIGIAIWDPRSSDYLRRQGRPPTACRRPAVTPPRPPG